MYLLRAFAGQRFDRVNALLEQQKNILNNFVNLIASTSYPFPEVLDALRCPVSVIPTEGTRGRRYFPKSGLFDSLEERAEELLRELLGLGQEYGASIQPHSGTQANQTAFNAVLGPGDVVLSLKPTLGGHISHTVTLGKRHPVVHYGLTTDGTLDYSTIEDLATKHRPKMLIAGASSYPRQIDFEILGRIARSVGAHLHADISHTALFQMSGDHAPVFPHADTASFNMMKNLRGPNGGVLIYRASLGKKIGYSLFPLTQGGPVESALFAKLVALEKLRDIDIKSYSRGVISRARRLAMVFRSRGLCLVSGGTDSHMLLVDLRPLGVTGAKAEERAEAHRILLNRNIVPGDERPPWVASGVRLGSACISILGFSEDDVDCLGHETASALLAGPTSTEVIHMLVEKYQHGLVSVE